MAAPSYRHRSIEPLLAQAIREFPLVVLTGPRQSGKTTLLQTLYGKRYRYVSLDPLHTRQFANKDPELFLEENNPPVIIDEIQYAPALLSYIKLWVDRHRRLRGQFLLTGSQQFPLMQGVSESLAGRAAILTLLPMSWAERLGDPKIKNHLWGRRPARAGAFAPPKALDLAQSWIRGSFPQMILEPKRNASLWYASYIQTYVERDVRTLRAVGDLGGFQDFLQSLAIRNAQILNLSELARSLGVAVNTAKAWLRVLEASHQIRLVRPYYRNKGKRLVKAPKVYFMDSGLVCHLTGVNDADQALKGPTAGALMETCVFGEIYRYFMNRGLLAPIYYWRTPQGDEVDFVIETAQRITALEVKLTKTPNWRQAEGIDKLRKVYSTEFGKGFVVCLADEKIPLGRFCDAVPFSWVTGI